MSWDWDPGPIKIVPEIDLPIISLTEEEVQQANQYGLAFHERAEEWRRKKRLQHKDGAERDALRAKEFDQLGVRAEFAACKHRKVPYVFDLDRWGRPDVDGYGVKAVYRPWHRFILRDYQLEKRKPDDKYMLVAELTHPKTYVIMGFIYVREVKEVGVFTNDFKPDRPPNWVIPHVALHNVPEG